VERSKQIEPGIIADFDEQGHLLGIEFLYVMRFPMLSKPQALSLALWSFLNRQLLTVKPGLLEAWAQAARKPRDILGFGCLYGGSNY